MGENKIIRIKNKMLTKEIESSLLYDSLNTIGVKKQKPLGRLSPTYWMIEIVRGCNLACFCCPTRLFPKKELKYMDIPTWKELMKIIRFTTPYTRVDLAQAGEPTLHPNIIEMLRIGRELSPNSFFEVITNGTLLIKNKITYKKLFDAGANLIFVDMYSPREVHFELAKKSGYPWYDREERPIKGHPAWNYNKDISIKQIVFADNPYNWSKGKKRVGILSNFLNDLDWPVAKKMGITPCFNAPNRRCSQPFRAVNVSYDGYYSFCCMDFMRHIYGKIGNVNNGMSEFLNFWFGKYMQETRKLLHNKKRNEHSLCKLCSYAFSRGDIPCWEDEITDFYWEENRWNQLEKY